MLIAECQKQDDADTAKLKPMTAAHAGLRALNEIQRIIERTGKHANLRGEIEVLKKWESQ